MMRGCLKTCYSPRMAIKQIGIMIFIMRNDDDEITHGFTCFQRKD